MARHLSPEDDLLKDLNEISNYVIGNERPEDVSFSERNTLPEAIAHVMTYPERATAVSDALKKMGLLSDMVKSLTKKIKFLEYKIELKKPKFT